MLRRAFVFLGLGAISLGLLVVPTASSASTTLQMNLNQTILVWNQVNDVQVPAYNYSIQMSTVSTLTGEAAAVGYTFDPALDPGPCPAPYQAYNYCGGPISSAALNPVDRKTYGLMSGPDGPTSELYRINPTTAAPTSVGILTLPNGVQPFNIRGIYFDAQGHLFAWLGSTAGGPVKIYSVNPNDGTMALTYSLPVNQFTGSVMSLQVNPAGELWAFTVVNNSGTVLTRGFTVDTTALTATQQFVVTGPGVRQAAFDSNGYLWINSSGDKLYALNVADAANTLELRGNLPNLSGAFVISDVPLAEATGIASGETITAGEGLSVSLENARASSPYTVEIHSTPVELASGRVTNLGVASINISLPSTIPAGSHTLVFTYLAPNGRVVTQEVPVTVAAVLANTGLNDPGLLVGGGLLFISGLLMVFWAARQKRLRVA